MPKLSSDGEFIISEVKDHGREIVLVQSKLCGSRWVDKKRGDDYYCDRAAGHMPSLLHRNRKNHAVWYRGVDD